MASFEEKIKELESIVRRLESGETSLEEAMELFEKGIAVSKDCEKLIKGAELKVTQLLDGEEKPFDTSGMEQEAQQ